MDAYRLLPKVDKLLAHPAWEVVPHVGRISRRHACRAVLDDLRAAIAAGDAGTDDCDLDRVAAASVARARADVQPALRRVVNATGVVLHTNLGRAPLADAALAAIADLGGGYLNLELDLEDGRRDNRLDRVADAASRVLGCGDVVVVNNNATAVFLALAALAGHGVGVVVSRGELVEIGGSFRMPDIMEASGASMVEVGTTNRTHPEDYAAALEAGAGVVLKVHRSNFDVVGFTSQVDVEALVALAAPSGALVVHDLGSGQLYGDDALGRDTISRSLEAGVDLVLFSGDKLLGGPQCGVVAGRADVVERLRRHPLMRMLRPGKLTLLALEATLREWERDPDGASIPAAALCARSQDDLRSDAGALAARLSALGDERLRAAVVDTRSTPGGGSSAPVQLPSAAVALELRGWSADALAADLRRADLSVVARIDDGRLLLDVRTLRSGDQDRVVATVTALLRGSLQP